MKLGSLAIRWVVGPLFMGHGAQKLWGAFGGHGPEGTGQFFEQLGIRPGRRNAIAAGASEFAGGAMLALGALTPFASSLISGTMLTAIRKAHAKKGPWVSEGGYEYNLVLLAAMVAVNDYGPGRPSVDEALFGELRGPFWAVSQLVAGAAASWVVTDALPEVTARGPQQGEAPAGGDGATAPEQQRFAREPSGVPAQGTAAQGTSGQGS
jgi:putative oxidoreductase